jgi:hypothetical protein
MVDIYVNICYNILMATSSIDGYLDLLPVLLAQPDNEHVEPKKTDMTIKLQRKYAEQLKRKAEVARIATGDSIVIAPTTIDDNGSYSESDKLQHTNAARRLARTIASLGVPNPIHVETDVNLDTLARIIDDEKVGHLIYVGHSDRSSLVLGGNNASWRSFDPDHLKRSVGILGCSDVYRGVLAPRVLANIVAPPEQGGIYFGRPNGPTYEHELYDLGAFQMLPQEMGD